jgi:glycosidase
MKYALRIIGLFVLLFAQTSLFAQDDFTKESIYFLMTTRFYDGDPTNNRPNEWCSYYPGNPNNANFSGPEDVTWRGDFLGLINKLDYIKDLGFTAIWITPIVQNRSPLDYHGYHAWDFTKVDPRLESPGADFKKLVDAAHAKGIKIVLDIVTNHSGRYGMKGVSELTYNTNPLMPWGQDSNGSPLQPNPNWQYDGMTANPDDGKIWSRANIAPMPSPYNSNLANYNWPCTEAFVNTSDPNYYHHSGNGFVQGWDDTENCYNRAIADDCPDLNTASQAVQDYMYNAYAQYINMGVDALRWDTYKHMDKNDIQPLLDRFKALKPDLFIFGEVAQKRHELHQVEELNPHWYTWRGAVNNSQPSGASVIDFYAQATFHNVFEDGGSMSQLQQCARYDNLYAEPRELVLWLDNHDFGPNNDWNRRFSGSDENLAACMNFMFTWRGIPCVYYGTEERFKAGAYTDLHQSSDINYSINETGRAYYGNEFGSAPSHIIYQHIKKLNAIRKAVPALQKGTYEWASAPGNGIAYKRKSGSSEVAVGLAKDGSATCSFTGMTNGIYRDAVTGAEINVTNGSMSFNVSSGSAGIYVLNGPGMIGGASMGFFPACAGNCNPTPVVSIAPTSGNYSAPVTVTISGTGGTGTHTIYYTLDGAMPTTSSSVYTGPLTVSSYKIVRAIAVDGTGKISDVNGQQYTFELPKPVVAISPAAGNYYDPITVTLTASLGNPPYQIYYTTNGTTPTTASTLYTGPFTLSTAATVKAFCVDNSSQTSSVVSAAYTFVVPAPTLTFSPPGGNFTTPPISVTITASSPRPPVQIYYTLDGSTPTTASTLYTGSIALDGSAPVTIKAIGVDSENRTSAVHPQTYTFNPIPDLKVHFYKPSTWAAAKIHYWNAVPTGSVASTTWPGLGMALEDANCEWYSYTFPSGVESINVIFNSGAGQQTVDLTGITGEKWYKDGVWYTSNPAACTPPTIPSAPTTLAATASGTTINLTWTDTSSDETSFVLQRSTTSGSGFADIATIAANTTSYSDSGLSANTTYYYRIKAVNSAGSSAWSNEANATTGAPAASIIVHFYKPTAWGAAYIHYWNAVPTGAVTATTWPGVAMSKECSEYDWYTYVFPSGVTSIDIVFNANSSPQTADLTGITGEKWYKDGVWYTSNPGPTCTAPTPPAAPTSLVATVNGVNITLNWVDNANNETSFVLQRSLYPDSGFADVATILANLTTYTDNNLNSNTTYYYRVKAVNSAGSSAWSNVANATTSTAPPPLTVHFFKPSGWSGAFIHYWNVTPTGALAQTTWPGVAMTKECPEYEWYSYTFPSGVTGTDIVFNQGNSSNQTGDLTGVTTEKWYKDGQWYVNHPGPTCVVAPNAPSGLVAVASSSTSIYLTWTDNEANDESQELQRALSAAGPFTTIATLGATATTYSDVWLSPNTTYYYRIRSSNANGDSAWSNVANATTSDCSVNIVKNENPIVPNTYKTSGTITSAGLVGVGTEVTFQAGTSVTLQAGFHAKAGSTFTAKIGTCGASSFDDEVQSRHDGTVAPVVALPQSLFVEVAPNPMSREAVVRYYVPESGEVALRLFDTNGRLVSQLPVKQQGSGWQELLFQPNGIAQGVYFLTVQTVKETVTKKVVIME